MPGNPTVLVVEDDPLVRDVIKRLLERAGFSVHIAANGMVGLAKLRDESLHAIVCDVRLPFLQGDDFFVQIEKLFPEMRRRVVFVTGWAHDEDVRRFLDGTGQPYLAKPFEADALIALVRQVAATT